MMIFDVTSDQIWRNLVSHYPRKTSILQKFSSPQTLFHLWKSLKYITRRNTMRVIDRDIL